ncbi:CML12 [Symbiodinium pilosum]|uniref:Calmodulin n=1 Tax=Symbiodinium pilosum TaxID=2952 RepID=A0A812QLZ5_SYMPI|nr:CML12 [Symbiodinium pilosum]
MVGEPFRPISPQTEWQGSTLADLAKSSKRASRYPDKNGRLPTPAYKKRQGPTIEVLGDSFATIDEEDSSSESSFGDGPDEAFPMPRGPRRLSKFSRHSVDDVLKKKTQSLLPDLQLVLERLRSGAEGLSESELERYNVAFFRFKDPDGPEMHKDELPHVLEFLGFPLPDAAQCREIADGCAEYETLEKADFITFMERYLDWELQRYKEIFSSYDEDGSGFLDTTELMTFISSLGFTPLRSMVKEALNLVDLDRNGLLDFEEVVLLMHCYRHTEGFTLDEVQTLSAIFTDVIEQVARRREGSNLLPADMLGDVLVQFFGPAQAAKARDLQQAFTKFDEDGSNSIDMDELQKVIKTLGYTMTKSTISEIKQIAFARTDLEDVCNKTSAEVLDSESMDYDSFVHFMLMLQQSDGFSKAEIQEIKATFKKFDEDGSGDIDVCELSDMLRFQGHYTSIDEVRRLHARVDFNGSGALDLAEFVRFMRLHREEMLESVRQAFDTLKDLSSGMLSPERIPLAVAKLDFANSNEDRRINVDPYLPHVALDFDGFVNLCDQIREAQVAADRKRAGFCDRDIEHFWGLFTSYDTKRCGVLTTEECTNLLAALGFHVRTVEEQQDLKGLLQQARNIAEAAGVDSRNDQGSVNFYVLLQLLQALFVNHEREAEAELTQVAEEADFSMSEVTEFLDIFSQYWAEELLPGEAENPNNRLTKKSITRSSVYKLLRAMGIRLDPTLKETLDKQVAHLSGERLDFHGFLRLMRWMVEVNFANINNGGNANG